MSSVDWENRLTLAGKGGKLWILSCRLKTVRGPVDGLAINRQNVLQYFWWLLCGRSFGCFMAWLMTLNLTWLNCATVGTCWILISSALMGCGYLLEMAVQIA